MSSESCSAVELVNVQFENNECSGVCGAMLSTRNNLTDIRMQSNRQIGEVLFITAVLHAPPNSQTEALRTVAFDNAGAVFFVEGGTLNISDSIFVRNEGRTDGDRYGASIHFEGARGTVRNCSFEENSALRGAGIYASRSRVRIRNSTFKRNVAEEGGAAVYISSCEEIELEDCVFSRNSLPASNGAAVSSNHTEFLTVRRGTFAENSAEYGGAVYVVGGPLEIEECQFLNNNASVDAGGILFRGTVFDARGVVLSNNSAVEYGGALLAYQSEEILISNLTCVHNTAEFGGCLRVRDTPLSVSSSVFIGNSVSNEGGGLSANTSTASIIGCLFRTNHGDFGGGLNLDIVESAEIRDTTIERNSASGGGGGAMLRTGRFNIADCRFEANSCDNFGGGFTCRNDAVLNVSRSLFLSNVAESGGAGSNVIVGCVAIFSNTNWTSNRLIDGFGGGAFVIGGRGVFEDSLFEQNVARDGAGVYVSSSSGTFRRIVLRNNSATVSGGGMGGFNGTVNVTDCHAERNEAEYGGAGYFSAGSDADIQRLVAVSNAASTSGGGLGVYESAVSVAHSVFAQNSAEGNGGTLYATTTSTLELRNVTVSNSSCGSNGGVLYAYSDSVVAIRHSNFRQSRAMTVGGGIAVLLSRLFLQDTTVTNARAERGGGLFLSTADAYINASHISDNFAVQRGGGIFAIETTLMAETLFMQRNTADNGGGAIDFSLGNSPFELANSTFLHNRGTFGGALAVRAGSVGHVVDSHAFNNSAWTSGGFAYVDDSNLTISGGQFIENSANFGGDIVVVNSGRLNVKGAEFRNGAATRRGGFLYGEDGCIIVVQNSSVSESVAEIGGAISLSESYFWGSELRIFECRADVDGGAIFANASSSVLCVGCDFENNSAFDKGGALYLESAKTQLLAFQLDNCTFKNNNAALGGKFFLTLYARNKLRSIGALHFVNEDRLVNCSEPNADCTFLALRGTNFLDNEASSAGGAILSSDLNAIRVSCSYEPEEDPLVYLDRVYFETLPVLNSLDSVCPNWSNNTAGDYGRDIASYARQIRKVLWFEESDEDVEVEGNIHILRNHTSGSPIPVLFMNVMDELDQFPVAGTGNETIVATMWSPDRLFTGAVNVRLEGGTGNISGISGYSIPGIYRVRVDFSEQSIPSFALFVEIRSCRLGEAFLARGTICQKCSGESYNFFPNEENVSCRPCPDHAKCGDSVIRPVKGYWHASPCSQHVQECLTEEACNDFERDERLGEISSTVQDCDLSTAFVENYTDALCRKGYQGPLCGSCESEFGRSRSFRCEPCFSGFGNFVLVLLSIVVLLVLSGFAIRSSLPSRKRTRNVQRRQRATADSTLALPGPSSATAPPVNVPMIEMTQTKSVSKNVTGESRQQAPHTPQVTQSNVELAKWKAVEIFKIAVNYLQVIAVAIAVNVNWTDTLVGLFETAEFLGGVTSEAATRSMDCLISSDSTIPRAAVRTVVNIMVPMLVTALYFIFFACVLVRAQETADYLLKRCILSFMAVAYLSYIALTKTAVNVLSCIDVHVWAGLEVDQTTRYWAVDTSLECYEGSHAVLAAMIGWPILIVFSFGFPVAVATALLLERNKHGMQNPWLFEATGFMYRAYKNDYVFWESIVMLRKAALAVIVVFSYSLGGNLQGVMGVCVLMIALYFQIVCCPFREEFDDLNSYEGLSLLVSALRFVSGLFFNDDRTSYGSRILLTILLVVANVGILLFFFAMFWKTSAEYLRCLLGAEGIKCSPEWGAFRVVKTYMFVRASEYSELLFRWKKTPNPSLLQVNP